MSGDIRTTGPSTEPVTEPSIAETNPVPTREGLNHLVSFRDRLTYTFIRGQEVASIHFDKSRGEIFYKGHNIRNMELDDAQLCVLEELRQLLVTDEKRGKFYDAYSRTLDKVILERFKK